jgi:hypothetical protein
MIISDRHKFAFVHIPKCAGTSVRRPLEKFDSYEGAFTGRVDSHPTLGQLDYVHIPLFSLRDHFPAEFRAIREYWSFAVMRDPFARFASSVSQRLKMYSDRPIRSCSSDEVRRAIDESIEYLTNKPREQCLLPPEYIHFQKQVDYIQLNGESVVDKIYLVDEVDTLLGDLGRIVGKNLLEPETFGAQGAKANVSVVYKNDLVRHVIESARPVTNRLGKILPENAKQRIRDRIYIPRDKRMRDLFAQEHVQAFITDYYEDDVRLLEQVRESRRCEAS